MHPTPQQEEIKLENPFAFPLPLGSMDCPEPSFGGMTLRDYFAAQALIGPVADLTGTAEEHAQIAYEYADAMLAERQKAIGGAE